MADETAVFADRNPRCGILFLEAGKAEFAEKGFFHWGTIAPPDCGESSMKWIWKDYLNVVSISVYGGDGKANCGK